MKPSSLLCVDRFTKKPRILSLYQDIHSIIQFCLSHNIHLSICSKSSNYENAQQILTSFGLWEYFQYPQIYYARKSVHFRNLRGCTNYLYHEYLFFDDEIRNIEICSNIGVRTQLVNKSTGLTWSTFLDGLKSYFIIQENENNIQLFSPLSPLPLGRFPSFNSSFNSPLTPNQKKIKTTHSTSPTILDTHHHTTSSFFFPDIVPSSPCDSPNDQIEIQSYGSDDDQTTLVLSSSHSAFHSVESFSTQKEEVVQIISSMNISPQYCHHSNSL